jgi:antitoxin ParD1/3/4
MAKNTSLLLGDYFDHFIRGLVQSGRYSSASEVVRSALRLFEEEEAKRAELVQALEKGEQSGFVQDVDREAMIRKFKENNGFQ